MKGSGGGGGGGACAAEAPLLQETSAEYDATDKVRNNLIYYRLC